MSALAFWIHPPPNDALKEDFDKNQIALNRSARLQSAALLAATRLLVDVTSIKLLTVWLRGPLSPLLLSETDAPGYTLRRDLNREVYLQRKTNL